MLLSGSNIPKDHLSTDCTGCYLGSVYVEGCNANGQTRIKPELECWRAVTQFVDKKGDKVYALAFSPDGAFLAVGTGEHAVHLINLQTREIITPPKLHDATDGATCLPPAPSSTDCCTTPKSSP